MNDKEISRMINKEIDILSKIISNRDQAKTSDDIVKGLNLVKGSVRNYLLIRSEKATLKYRKNKQRKTARLSLGKYQVF